MGLRQRETEERDLSPIRRLFTAVCSFQHCGSLLWDFEGFVCNEKKTSWDTELVCWFTHSWRWRTKITLKSRENTLSLFWSTYFRYWILKQYNRTLNSDISPLPLQLATPRTLGPKASVTAKEPALWFTLSDGSHSSDEPACCVFSPQIRLCWKD